MAEVAPVGRFGTLEGRDVLEVTLESGGGAVAKVLTYGAVIRDLVVPAARGPQRVVLGLNTIEDYVAHSPYFGAVVGRYANRIGQARFTLAGETVRLLPNEKGRNQLHGGPTGFGKRHWTLVDHNSASATLVLVSEDGDGGYPGRLVALCRYLWAGPATLRIDLEAQVDRPCPVNLTTHSYFNLDGSPDIGGHRLMIAADHVTPTDADLIPTGEVRSVDGTAHDFRSLRPIGAAATRPLYDINYVLRSGGPELAHAATLHSEASGVGLDLWTSEPGLQFYGGHLLAVPVPGLDGARYGPGAGLCLEPQRFPDGPNHAHFPPCLLKPGQASRQASELRFSVL